MRRTKQCLRLYQHVSVPVPDLLLRKYPKCSRSDSVLCLAVLFVHLKRQALTSIANCHGCHRHFLPLIFCLQFYRNLCTVADHMRRCAFLNQIVASRIKPSAYRIPVSSRCQSALNERILSVYRHTSLILYGICCIQIKHCSG